MLNQLFDKAVSAHSDATAIVYDDRRMSYFELFIYVEWMGRYFQSIAIRPGQRVAIFMPISPELVISFLGLLRVGGVAVHLEVTDHPDEIRSALELAQVGAIITTPSCKALLDEAISAHGHDGALLSQLPVAVFEEDNIVTLGNTRQDLASDSKRNGKVSSLSRNYNESYVTVRGGNGKAPVKDPEENWTDHPALIQFSSDTGKKRQLDVLSHRDLVQEAEATMAKIQLSAADRLLYVASPSRTNSFGSCLIAAIAAGATLVILETSDWDEILPVLAGEQVTIFAGTASLFTRLTENAPDKLREIPSLRWCFCAGPPLPPEIGERLYRRIGINIEQLASHFDSSTPQRA